MDADNVQFSSNAVRLSPREWLVAIGLIAVVFIFTPVVWKRIEPLEVEPDHRLPFSLSSDYWTYSRYARDVGMQDRTLVIGDSVVWGHYVAPDRTLSAHLNALAGERRFANLGVDGIHPVALEGLVRYYGRAITDKRVILHGNLLWMSSKKHDLQTKKEFTFQHPRLAPQFHPSIPCYREGVAGRLAIAIGRPLPFANWSQHLRSAYFEGKDLPTWTLDHPYENPLGAITLRLPSPDEPPAPEPVAESWTRKQIPMFNPQWVDLDTSLQWRAFRRTVEILQRRGNTVFVIVGPFNEHMLKPESLVIYRKRKREVAGWLRERGVAHFLPSPLPSDLYADASHPLAEGYAMLAKHVLENDAFVRFDTRGSRDDGGRAP